MQRTVSGKIELDLRISQAAYRLADTQRTVRYSCAGNHGIAVS